MRVKPCNALEWAAATLVGQPRNSPELHTLEEKRSVK